MRATFEGMEVEGTPEEIAKFYAAMRPARHDLSSTSNINEKLSVEKPEGGIPEAFAYRALRRLPLSAAQKSLLKVLRDAHPNWVLSSELQAEMKCSPTSLGGVFGGLGRRISATKDYQVGYNLWDWKWDEDEGEWTYRLPEAVILALARADI
jgi:hypothetical protein